MEKEIKVKAKIISSCLCSPSMPRISIDYDSAYEQLEKLKMDTFPESFPKTKIIVELETELSGRPCTIYGYPCKFVIV